MANNKVLPWFFLKTQVTEAFPGTLDSAQNPFWVDNGNPNAPGNANQAQTLLNT